MIDFINDSGFIIGLDFDGTVVTHEYPNIGRDIGAQEVLQDLAKKGVRFVLNTMRSGEDLEKAVQWFKDNNISLYGINENPDQKAWTQSPKVYANMYIDDAALGVPLVYSLNVERPYVDWSKVRIMLFGLSDESMKKYIELLAEVNPSKI